MIEPFIKITDMVSKKATK